MDNIAPKDAGLIMAHAETAYMAEADYADHLLIEVGARDFVVDVSARALASFSGSSAG